MSIIGSLFIAIVSSIITVYLALWRFHSERWLELKIETYAKVLEALHQIKKNDDLFYQDFLSGYFDKEGEYKEGKGKLSPEEMESLRKSTEIALEKINKIVDVASFIISPDGLKEIEKLKNKYGKVNFEEEDIEDIYKNQSSLIKDCLTIMRDIARKDIMPVTSRVKDFLSKKIHL